LDTIGLDHCAFIGVVAIWVLFTIVAELVHSYRSRSVRVLADRYTLGYILALLTFVVRLTFLQIRPEMPLYMIMFYLGIIDYCSLYLFCVYSFVRGGHMVAILFGKRRSYETNWPVSKRLEMCSLIAWTLAVIVIIRIGGFIVVWLLDIIVD